MEITQHLQAEIVRAQHKQQEYADTRRSPAPRFKVGDQVWFNARNVTTQRPSRKLDHRRIGPYKILRIISPYAYELEFPDTVQYHRVQHVSLLDPADDNPLPGQHNPPPPPVVIEGEEYWHVQEILDARVRRRNLEYLVRWVGYDQPDWQPATVVRYLKAV